MEDSIANKQEAGDGAEMLSVPILGGRDAARDRASLTGMLMAQFIYL